MTEKPPHKYCPLLEGFGIKAENSRGGAILCLKCPLDRCIFDYPGRVSKKDMDKLEEAKDVMIRALEESNKE